MPHDGIVILDFGSQYTQLIARRIRSHNVFSEILPCTAGREAISKFKPKGIVLSGGPSSVYEREAPVLPDQLWSFGVPVLGICYGMHLVAQHLGAEVIQSSSGEYGFTVIQTAADSALFNATPAAQRVWMSHRDRVSGKTASMQVLASSVNCKIASFHDPESNFYGVQFHPEVQHTEFGEQILKNFLFDICRCSPNWQIGGIAAEKIEEIKKTVGDKRIICAVSGGVDSSVTAALIDRAVGDRLFSVFVDNGLLRDNEVDTVKALFKGHFTAPLHIVRAGERFLQQLRGVTDPEKKRKIIGHLFIEIFDEVSREKGPFQFLAQGTLYPDRIESSATVGPSATIKTHHNVGGLPENLNFELVEPLALLFKDEVREIGLSLGLPSDQLMRHPFPGPGLGVRVLGEVTEEKLSILRKADKIFVDALKQWNLYDKIWQAGAILLPVRTVGVMGDARTYSYPVVLRAVTSTDGMTADWAVLENDFLKEVSNQIINSVSGINRVVYDVSSKPPSTIEWEYTPPAGARHPHIRCIPSQTSCSHKVRCCFERVSYHRMLHCMLDNGHDLLRQPFRPLGLQ
jgi:GMP synthase (glutamine-hydrolysing)